MKIAKFDPPFFREDAYKVYSYHTDSRCRLSLTAMLHFLQETAGSHATANGFGFDMLGASKLFWVLSRLTLKVAAYPRWNDELLLRTWSKAPGALMGNRDFELLNAQGEVVAVASTAWLMVDVASRRPQRIERFGSAFPHVLDRHAIPEPPEKLPAVAVGEAAETSEAKEIVLSDMDMNGHVNNACYVRWALDAFPLHRQGDGEVRTLEVNFLHESRAGEHYAVSGRQTAEKTRSYSITRCEDGRELARVRIGV
jgi:medium-chain acyl-[acyl-carrier-protein] hydrolase